MRNLENLLRTLRQIEESGPDPSFATCDVKDQVLAADLDRPAWRALLANSEFHESALVSAGIAWSLAKEADSENSVLELPDLFPFLSSHRVDDEALRRFALSAAHLWLMKTPVKQIEDETIEDILSLISRSVNGTEDNVSREVALDIVYGLAFDLDEAQRVLPEGLRSQLVQTLNEELVGLAMVYEKLRQEALELFETLPSADPEGL